ncbi:hypothetical protein ABZ890_46780 [Streptomyces sp. NPDC046984]|uniref:hypothetical protein n=1 Tax=Streptomyces sp. NPDC046984 TaxID=3155138 RepID=UPI00340DD043
MTVPIHLVTAPPARSRPALRLLSTLVAAALLVLAAVLVPASEAVAAARVTMTPATADPDYASKIRVHGAGFQSVKNGFGGIYVLFGTVSGTWRPSQGGTSGVDYVYVQDSETKDNHGYQRFVAFPGDPTAYAANGGTLKADGTWDATLVIPGAVFPAKGRDGGIRQIDCRKVQCGVITIGAHGVANPSNETFTPVTFAAPGRQAPATKTAPPAPAKTKHTAPTEQPSAASPAAADASSAIPQQTSSPHAADPTTGNTTTSVASEPAVSATSTSGAGRLAVMGAALVVLVLATLLLLRRRKRAGAASTKTEEK